MNAGIWIDQRKAVVVVIDGDSENIFEIISNVPEGHTKGGYGGPNKSMPQDARSDKKMTEKRQQETKKFFEAIVKGLPKVERLLVFGPGEGKKGFVAFLRAKPKFAETRIRSEASDQINMNKIHARVQEYFKVKHTRVPKDKMKGIRDNGLIVEHEFVRMRSSTATQDFVMEKLNALKERYPDIIRAKLYHKKDKDPAAKNFLSEIQLSIPGTNLFAMSKAADLAAAITESIGDLETQLRKRKSRRIKG